MSSLAGALDGRENDTMSFDPTSMSSLTSMPISVEPQQLHGVASGPNDGGLYGMDLSSPPPGHFSAPAQSQSYSSGAPTFFDPNVLMSLVGEESKYSIPTAGTNSGLSVSGVPSTGPSFVRQGVTMDLPTGAMAYDVNVMSMTDALSSFSHSSPPQLTRSPHNFSPASRSSAWGPQFEGVPQQAHSLQSLPVTPTTSAVGSHPVATSAPPPTKIPSPGRSGVNPSQAAVLSDIPLSGMIPTASGPAVPVRAMIDSLLENVIKTANSARSAYHRGESDQTHQKLEEMIESLRLVGGLGVGPQIGAIRSNRADVDMDADLPMPVENAELQATGSFAGATPSPQPPTQPPGLSPSIGTITTHSNNSSLSPPSAQQTLPVPMSSLAKSYSSSISPTPVPSVASSSVSVTPAMLSTLAASPLQAVSPSSMSNAGLTSPPEILPNNVAMAQVPGAIGAVAAYSDPARKRTTASAPSLGEGEGRPPVRANKVQKLTPPPVGSPEIKPNVASGRQKGSTGMLAAGSPITSAGPTGPTGPPAGFAAINTPPLSVGVATTEPPSKPSSRHHQKVPSVASGTTHLHKPPPSHGSQSGHFSPGSAAGTGSPLGPSPAGPGSASSTALLNGWAGDQVPGSTSASTGGVVIPPPHSSAPERRMSSDSYRIKAPLRVSSGGYGLAGPPPPDGAALAAQGTLQRSLQLDAAGISGIASNARSARAPSWSTARPAAGFLMDVDDGSGAIKPDPEQGYLPIDAFEGSPDPMGHPDSSKGGTDLSTSAGPSMQSVGAASTFKGGASSRPPTPAGSDGGNRGGDDSDGDSDSGDDGEGYGYGTSVSRRSSFSRPNVGGTDADYNTYGNSKGPRKHEGSSATNTVNAELKGEMDRIFLEYLNRICSDLEAKDSKGEAIHQTLMAKKMARLDESPDFRPFKFRIQAFTNGFVEELEQNRYGEDVLPLKKVKAYLWHQNPYIARFNEDGKKAKSKGNHIWNVEAKKIPSKDASPQKWIFKQFTRRIAGTPPSMAYIGLRWTFEPKIWDPQLSRASIQAEFSSPNLPPWLGWSKNVLTGVPGSEATDGDITVEARFIQDGVEKTLQTTFSIMVAPLAVGDAAFVKSRRPSLGHGELSNSRRFASESVLSSVSPTRPAPPQVNSLLPPPAATPAESAQVVQVLANAAHRVAQEAHSQAVYTPVPGPAQAHAQASLAKQQRVLTVTAQAVGHEAGMAGMGMVMDDQAAATSSVLVAAAQQVVHQAARQVQADRTALAAMQQHLNHAPIPPPPPPPVSLNDVSVVTQSAVAHAVAITGTTSTDVEVMMTANALIQQRSRAPSLPRNPLSSGPEPTRPPAVSAATHPSLPTSGTLHSHGLPPAGSHPSNYHR